MPSSLEVLIPHYNNPVGLAASLASVAVQGWGGRITALVVDDGSPAEEWAAVQTVCAQATRGSVADFSVRLIRQEQNLGRPRTRNRLLAEARAPWLAWLDAGDLWYPSRLSVQFAHLAEQMRAGADPHSLWVSCSYDWEQAGRVRSLHQEVSGDQICELLAGDRLRAYLWTLLGSARAFRMAGLFDERLPRLQDLDYFLSFVRGGGKIAVPPGNMPLCRYFKSDEGRSPREVRESYHLILNKLAPVTARYGSGVQARLRFNAEMLAARFAGANGMRGFQAACLLRAARAAPVEMTKSVVRKVLV
jgi:glycosyltransferase involved in cell wall biosynthesis